jgi:hypothetical protein
MSKMDYGAVLDRKKAIQLFSRYEAERTKNDVLTRIADTGTKIEIVRDNVTGSYSLKIQAMNCLEYWIGWIPF